MYRYAAKPITKPYCTAKKRYKSVYRYIDTALLPTHYCRVVFNSSLNNDKNTNMYLLVCIITIFYTEIFQDFVVFDIDFKFSFSFHNTAILK